MRQQGLHVIIRQKLRDGTLPYNSIPRVWGGPGNGETCDACDGIVTKDEWVIEGISLAEGRKPLQLHAECFHLWETERHAVAPKAEPQTQPEQDGPRAA
jgi:hypothetical protein